MVDAYYAVDRYQIATLADELLHQIKGSVESTHAFALIDLAFDHETTKALAWPTALTRLYSSGSLAPLSTVSPALVPLLVRDELSLIQQLRSLLRHANGRPMLSFLQTDFSAESLSAHLHPFLHAETADGQHYLLRWGDTRVLPALAKNLPAEVWTAITDPLHTWMFVNRHGTLERLRLLRIQPSRLRASTSVKLDTPTLELLLKEGEPDAVIQALRDVLPHLLPNGNRASFYERIKACCQFAASHGVEAFPDVLSLATAECLSKESLLADPQLVELLVDADWKAGKLGDRLINLMPQEIE